MNYINRHISKEKTQALKGQWFLQLVIILLGATTLSAQIEIDFSIDEPSCNGFLNGNITAQASGGTPPYSYLWDNLQAGPTNFGIGAGDYSVTITDANGLFASETVTMGEPPELEVIVEPIGDICLGTAGELIANASGGTSPYSYFWTTGATTQTISDLVPGYYGVTVYDVNGCKAIHGIVVNKPLTVTVKATDVLCYEWCDGAVEAIPMGGTGPYTYVWNTGQTGSILNMLPTGTFSVTVTDSNGCTAEASGTIGEPDEIEITIDIDDLCSGAANADIEVMGGIPPYSYQWNDDNGLPYSNSQDLSDLPEGYYFLTVTDANGCLQDTSIVVSDGVEIVPFPTPEDCEGTNSGSVIVEVPNGIGPLTFYLSNGIVSDTKTIDSLSAGTYGVTVVDGAGCSDSTTFEIGAGVSLDIEVNTTISQCGNSCDGTATLTVSGGTAPYTYLWDINTTSQTTQTAIDLCPGYYLVTVTDANNCEKVIPVTIEEGPSGMEATIEVTEAGCDSSCNGTAMIDISGGTPPYSLSWTPNIGLDNGVEIVDLCAGDYSLTITDQNQCTLVETFTIEESDPLTLLVEVTDASCENSTDGCTELTTIVPDNAPPFSIEWSNGVTDSLNCGLAPGIYGVTVTDANACVGIVDSIIVEADSDIEAMFDWQVDNCDSDSISITFIDSSETDSLNNIISWEWIFSTGQTANDSVVFITVSVPVIDVTLVVENSAGCVDTLMEQIMLDMITCNSMLQDTMVCQGDSLWVETNCTSPDSLLTYQWAPDSLIIAGATTSTAQINTSEPGSYLIWLTVSNSMACDVVDTMEVVVMDTSLNIDPNLISFEQSCDTTEICFTNANDSLAFTYYSWYFDYPNMTAISSEFEPCFIFPDSGEYLITLVPNGACLDTFEFSIQVEEIAKTGIDFQKEDCSDSVDVLFYHVSTPFNKIDSLSWNFGNGMTDVQDSVLITVTDSNQVLTATLEVFFENGCVKTDTLEVPVEVFIPAYPADTVIACGPGMPIELNPHGDSTLSYLWAPGDNLVPIDTFWNPTATVNDTTIFSVSIDSAHCSVNQEVMVVFAPEIELSLLPPDPIEVCETMDTLLIATSNISVDYAWYDNEDYSEPPLSTDSTMMITVGDSTTYYVVATDEYGCQEIESLAVGNYEIVVWIPDTLDICKGSLIDFEIEGLDPENHIVSWSPLDPIGLLIAQTTSFDLTVENDQGCKFSDDLLANFVDIDNLLDVYPRLDTIVRGDTVHISAYFDPNYIYDWDPVISLSDPEDCCPIASPEETTLYNLFVFDPLTECEGRGFSEICVINDRCDEQMIFFPNAFTPNGDGLNDVLYVEGFNVDEVFFEIYNRWGEKVFESHAQDEGWDGTYNGQPAPTDAYAYYLRVRCEFGGEYTKQGNVTVIR